MATVQTIAEKYTIIECATFRHDVGGAYSRAEKAATSTAYHKLGSSYGQRDHPRPVHLLRRRGRKRGAHRRRVGVARVCS
jgi:hypothetical protein